MTTCLLGSKRKPDTNSDCCDSECLYRQNGETAPSRARSGGFQQGPMLAHCRRLQRLPCPALPSAACLDERNVRREVQRPAAGVTFSPGLGDAQKQLGSIASANHDWWDSFGPTNSLVKGNRRAVPIPRYSAVGQRLATCRTGFDLATRGRPCAGRFRQTQKPSPWC